MTYICKYISYQEATKSQTATRLSINNTPNDYQLNNMRYVGQNLFDPMREYFGVAIGVSSFLRVPELNKAIGGSKRSFHPYGMAIDADGDIYDGVTNKEIFYFIKDSLPFTELIWEYGNEENPAWVHMALVEGREEEKQLKRIFKDSNGETHVIPFDLY